MHKSNVPMDIKLQNPSLAYHYATNILRNTKKASLSYAEKVRDDRKATMVLMFIMVLFSVLYSIV